MTKNGQLFNSKTDPIPRLRPELEIIPVTTNGRSYIYFHDMLGYATDDFVLDREAGSILSLLDGQKSIKDLSPYLGEGVTTDRLLEYIRFLDEHRLLYSTHLMNHMEAVESGYESSTVHQPVTTGSSYPSEPDKLSAYLDEAFQKHNARNNSNKHGGRIKALFAPHIDPRVGLDSYAKAFSAIRDLSPKRVFILATSHYSGLYSDLYENIPFIVSKKDFKMPLGKTCTDKEAADALLGRSETFGISGRDRAYRIEHSIELHLLFLNYIWDHEFEIVPVLVRDFSDLYYMENGHLGEQVQRFGSYLNKTYGEDDDTFFLVSGDLAHIGRKFGDRQPASEMFDEVKSFDRMFLNYAEQGNSDALLSLMKDQYDPYRICGFAPLYSFLKAMPEASGTTLSYDLWDETERESAVTFGSILYTV